MKRLNIAKGIPFETKAYACIHVLEGTRPALYVTREDGDWAILCGGVHPEDPDYYPVVGLGHIVDADPTLREILDLTHNQEAERAVVGGPWTRVQL